MYVYVWKEKKTSSTWPILRTKEMEVSYSHDRIKAPRHITLSGRCPASASLTWHLPPPSHSSAPALVSKLRLRVSESAPARPGCQAPEPEPVGESLPIRQYTRGETMPSAESSDKIATTPLQPTTRHLQKPTISNIRANLRLTFNVSLGIDSLIICWTSIMIIILAFI